jgi:hypothetical protein
MPQPKSKRQDTKPAVVVKLRTYCTLHGASGQRAACPLSTTVRQAWRKLRASHGESIEKIILTAVESARPSHGAVCAEKGNDTDWCGAQRALKSAQRSARVRATWAAKRRGRAYLAACEQKLQPKRDPCPTG